MNLPKLGLLPLYAGLYDRNNPQAKHNYAPYIDEVAALLEAEGVQVLRSPVAVYQQDIQSAITRFEEQAADAVAILFLAYHPSLESEEPLSRTKLPLVMLDVTRSFRFGPDGDPAMIASCHGIHGVQDLCCVLRRAGVEYEVYAGHYTQSDAIARTARFASAAKMAKAFRDSRVGVLGAPFDKMGDFAIPFDKIEQLTGVKSIPLSLSTANEFVSALTEEQIEQEMIEQERALERAADFTDELARDAARTTLAIRNWARAEGLNAFTFNFLDFNDLPLLPAVPFIASGRLMSEGIGYAGEGDALTAALTASLMTIYPNSSFCEMFCPDWQGGTVFMSHMGEINLNVAEKKRMIKKTVSFLKNFNGGTTSGVSARFVGGDAVLVNLAPHERDRFTLTLVPGEMVAVEGDDNFPMSVRGWFRPGMGVGEFLERYSKIGATHHSCVCYGADLDLLKCFGELMGFDVQIIK